MLIQICSGSNMDGVDIDLIVFAELPELSCQQHDALWGATSELELLEECMSAYFDWQDEDDVENVPNYTDHSFTVFTNEIETLKMELRSAILARIG